MPCVVGKVSTSHEFIRAEDELNSLRNFALFMSLAGADLGGGCRGCAPPPRDDLRFSNTTGILPKNKNYVVYWC